VRDNLKTVRDAISLYYSLIQSGIKAFNWYQINDLYWPW